MTGLRKEKIDTCKIIRLRDTYTYKNLRLYANMDHFFINLFQKKLTKKKKRTFVK